MASHVAGRAPRGLALSLLVATGCTFDFGVTYGEGGGLAATTTGAGGAPSTGTSGAVGGGGAGSPVACDGVTCPSVDCYETSCEGATCVLTPREPGDPCGPGGAQTCDASLRCVACDDAGDCAAPLSSCRTVACVDGSCVETPVGERRPCVGEPGVCTSAQECVGCIDVGDCDPGEVCRSGACEVPAATCSDGLPNAGESATDCGGPCPPCDNGQTCMQPADCQSGHCDGVCSACLVPVDCVGGTWCSDGVCVPRKSDGVPCGTHGECTSGYCVDGVCCESACSSPCLSCRTGGNLPDGTCGAELVGNDPAGDCVEAPCRPGTCDGLGQCSVDGDGAACTQCAIDAGGQVKVYGGQCYIGGCVVNLGSETGCAEGQTCNAARTGCR